MDHFVNDPYNAAARAADNANSETRRLSRTTLLKGEQHSKDLLRLEARVNALENTVSDLLRALSQDGIIEVE